MRLGLVVVLLTALLALIYWVASDAGDQAERVLAGSEPGARNELEAVLAVPRAQVRALRLAQYFDEASPADLDAILRTYESAEAYVDALALVLLADWWANFDPADAYNHTLGWRFRDADAARFAIVRSWARQMPAAAAQVVDERRGEPNSDLLSQALVVGWAERDDASGVWSYLAGLPTGLEVQKDLQALISRSLVAKGVDETLRIVEALPDDAANRFKLQAYRRTAWALGRYDPERAKEWAEQHAEGPFGDGLFRLVGVSPAHADGGALEWLQTLRPGDQRDEAVLEAFRSWLNRDREAAIQWLRDAEPNAALEPALVLLVSNVGRSDPEEAQAILERIQDPAIREAAHVFLARAWMTHDREAALSWFETAPVSEESRRRVLEGRPGMPTPRRRQSADSASQQRSALP